MAWVERGVSGVYWRAAAISEDFEDSKHEQCSVATWGDA